LSLKRGKGDGGVKIRGVWEGNKDEGEGWAGITVCGGEESG